MGVAMIKRGEHMEIRSLIENGVSVSAISRMLGVDRKTVRKYKHMDIYSPYFRKKRQKGNWSLTRNI